MSHLYDHNMHHAEVRNLSMYLNNGKPEYMSVQVFQQCILRKIWNPQSFLDSCQYCPSKSYCTMHRKGNDNFTSQITVFGKSTSLSVKFWQLSTDRHGALTGNGYRLTVTVWRLMVLHLHMCTGIYAESISW